MDHSFEATTVEMDNAGFNALKDQLSSGSNKKAENQKEAKPDIKEPKKESVSNRKYVFKKGDDSLELDDDFEIEFMADKRPTKMTLRELKDRAAGDVAIKNRMHSLAEEKKKIQATFREFSEMAKKDPLGALEFISNKAKETDSEFEYDKYIEKLAEQAEKLGQMNDSERKAWELEKKLQKAEQDLSHKERQQAVIERKNEIMSAFPEIGDQEFSQMVDAVLENDELMENAENEHDVMNQVEELIKETLTQRDIISVIEDVDPSFADDNELIYALSDEIRQNPDLDEQDVRFIVSEILQPIEKAKPVRKAKEKDRDARVLSEKARDANALGNIRTKNADPYDLLKEQLIQRKSEISKTPLYMR